jgi:hypothetical protein
MTSPRIISVVHIEDQGEAWRVVPRAIRNGLFEDLVENERLTLVYTPPRNRTAYPCQYRITWTHGGSSFVLDYWIVETETVGEVRGSIQGKSLFVIDVMRPDDKGGLRSSLVSSVNSIREFVTDWDAQVRVFTAFGIPESDREKIPKLQVISKSEPTRIVAFVLESVRATMKL